MRKSEQNKSGNVVWGFVQITAFAFNFLTHSFSHSMVRRLIEYQRKVKYYSKYLTLNSVKLNLVLRTISLNYTGPLNLDLEPPDTARTCA